MITVYHRKTLYCTGAPGSSLANLKIKFSDYKQVALVASDDLTRAFELTNTVHCRWPDHAGVINVTGNRKIRSTSVGDLLVTEDETVYVVNDVCGFIKACIL